MAEAKATARDRYKTFEFWYRQHYKLTSNDPRFLDATLEEMMADYYAHTYFVDPKAVEDTVEDEDFNPDDVAKLIGFEPDPGDFEEMP